MSPQEKLLAVARAELGYLEKKSNAQLDEPKANAGYNNFTKYARDLDKLGIYNGPKNGFAWCDVFVDWCFVRAFGVETALKMTGQAKGGIGAGCDGSALYYRNMSRFHRDGAQPGDQVFFTRDGGKTFYHTGIVEKVEGGTVFTIEGNTGSAAGVIPNGGGVYRKAYPVGSASIGGFGRPDWGAVAEEEEKKEENAVQEKRFNSLEEIRAGAPWAVATVEGLVRGGVLEGSGKKDAEGFPADLDLSLDMIRLLVVLDRIGVFGK